MHETKSLILRHYKSSDDDDLLEYWNDASILDTGTYGYAVPITLPELQKRLSSFNPLMWVVIVEKSTGDFVGTVSLQFGAGGQKNRDAALALAIMPAKQRKGYATEAVNFMVDYGFRSLGLHRVSLDVFEGNPGAYALYIKCGFVEEGRRRKCLWRNGDWEDVINMGILDTEWRKRTLSPQQAV